MDCPICIEKYNENTRKKITCKCNYEACLKCVKTYILDKSHLNPHCMSCRSIWGIELIQTYFSKYFINLLRLKYECPDPTKCAQSSN